MCAPALLLLNPNGGRLLCLHTLCLYLTCAIRGGIGRCERSLLFCGLPPLLSSAQGSVHHGWSHVALTGQHGATQLQLCFMNSLTPGQQASNKRRHENATAMRSMQVITRREAHIPQNCNWPAPAHILSHPLRSFHPCLAAVYPALPRLTHLPPELHAHTKYSPPLFTPPNAAVRVP